MLYVREGSSEKSVILGLFSSSHRLITNQKNNEVLSGKVIVRSSVSRFIDRDPKKRSQQPAS